jgi:hypothetical protein
LPYFRSFFWIMCIIISRQSMLSKDEHTRSHSLFFQKCFNILCNL